MVKKLEGDFFFLSANDLISGNVVFFSKKGWSNNKSSALKIKKSELKKYEEISKQEEKNCKIVSPAFVELNELGNIKKLRDKIRYKGVTIKYK
tara:strand:- start:614 stop:892 length:279 start_codon:yes stop_codon:yes gene_type:complete